MTGLDASMAIVGSLAHADPWCVGLSLKQRW
jgi:hypothetical protein